MAAIVASLAITLAIVLAAAVIARCQTPGNFDDLP
jgi:hypothetical protein